MMPNPGQNQMRYVFSFTFPVNDCFKLFCTLTPLNYWQDGEEDESSESEDSDESGASNALKVCILCYLL